MGKKEELQALIYQIENEVNSFSADVVERMNLIKLEVDTLVNSIVSYSNSSFSNIKFDIDSAQGILDSLVEEIPNEPIPPEPEPLLKLLHQVTFENGAIPTGNLYFLKQNNGSIKVVSNPVGTGKVGALTIAGTGSNAAYLFFTRSIWPTYARVEWKYFIPQTVVPGAWWNIAQWKITNGSQSFAQWSLGVTSSKELYVAYQPESGSSGRTYTGIILPWGQWFKFSVDYKEDVANGLMIVRLNDSEAYRSEDKPTITTTLPQINMSINNYNDNNSCTIYVDDISLWSIIV